jgi:hypothetical protein
MGAMASNEGSFGEGKWWSGLVTFLARLARPSDEETQQLETELPVRSAAADSSASMSSDVMMLPAIA